MIIVADEGIPRLDALHQFGDVRVVSGRHLRAESLEDAGILLVRSVTPVNAALLSGSQVRFVASATAGTDHLDLAWLAAQGIQVAWAPGSNAMAVAEYVLQAFLQHASRLATPPHKLTAGLAGFGHVGRRVARLLGALGVRVLVYDPLVQVPDAPQLISCKCVDDILDATMVSLHVPLVYDGKHPTRHLLDAHRLQRLHTGQLLVNTSRGSVVDNLALARRLADVRPPEVILDVWEKEPDISSELLSLVRFGTPHVAGHSIEGKLQGSDMIFSALEQWLHSASDSVRSGRKVSASGGRADEVVRTLQMDVDGTDGLLWLMQRCYDLPEESDRLKSWPADESLASHFDQVRRNRADRHELATLALQGRVVPALRPVLSELGVTVAGS